MNVPRVACRTVPVCRTGYRYEDGLHPGMCAAMERTAELFLATLLSTWAPRFLFWGWRRRRRKSSSRGKGDRGKRARGTSVKGPGGVGTGARALGAENKRGSLDGRAGVCAAHVTVHWPGTYARMQ